MKKGKLTYIRVLLLLTIPLMVFPIPAGFFASQAWAEDDSPATLVISPTSLTFTYQQGGAPPASQTLSVTSNRTISFTDSRSTTSGGSWLSVGSTSGTTPGSIRVSVQPGTLSVGNYGGAVLVSSRAGSVTVPVTLKITSAPTVAVSPTALTFSYQQGGTLPSSKTLSVSSSGSAISFTDSTSGASWLSVGRTSGSTPSSIGVSVNPGALGAGTYNASVKVSSTATATSVTIPVTLTITSATSGIAASPTSLGFSYQQGGSAPSPQSLSVISNGSTINFTDSTSGASWLSVSRTSGTTPGSIGVSVSPGGMAAGTYTASVRVSSTANSVTIPVTLTITSATSGIGVSPSSLAFSYQQGGTVPPSQSLSVSGSGTVSFTDTASGGSWLSTGSTSGTTPGSIRVSVTPGTLAAGTYRGSVVVTASTNSVTIPVTLTITSSSGGGGGSGGYVLLAWAELGMHCVDGKDYSVLSILPPYNTIYAKLLSTGSTPTNITSGVTLTYTAMGDSSGSINTTSIGSATSPYKTTPSTPQKTNFWDYVYALLRTTLAPDMGAKGFPMQNLNPESMAYGSFVLDANLQEWKAEGIPLMPYDDTLAAKPYPMAKITATDSSGNVLATTTVVLAVSDEVSCKNCHAANTTNSAAVPASGWVNFSNLSADQNMRLNVLKKHDERNNPNTNSNWSSVIAGVNAKGYNYQTSLYQTAVTASGNTGTATLTGNPILCANCHQSNALWAAVGLTGVSGALPMTQAMHTLHSQVTLPNSTATLDNSTDPTNTKTFGCYQCHPGPTTQCQRGVMTGTIPGSTAVSCYGCHGNLTNVGSASRQGWLDVPNCQMCHQNGTTYTSAFSSGTTYRTSTDTTFATTPNSPPPPPNTTGPFSLYRYSTGHGSVECSGCHGAQHAEYPTNQANDNVSSINLQGYAGRVTECSVCHTSSFATTNNGGPHGMHTVGSAWVSAHPSYASSSTTGPCAYCHGTDFRGTSLSMILTTKTLAGKTFPAYHQMNCYDCHNGPSGD